MRKFYIIPILLLICIFSFSNQKKEVIPEKSNINFIFINDNISKMINSENNNNSYNLNKELYAAKFSKEQLFKTGRNLLIFGSVCGVISGALFGVGFIFTYILSNTLSLTFQQTFMTLLFSFSTVYETSYFASLAIGSWVLGFVFAGLFLFIIPGAILMAVSYNRDKKISRLNDAVGFSIKLN